MTCAAIFSINYGLDTMLEILLPWRYKLLYLLLVTCPYQGLSPAEATWEVLDIMKKQFPNYNLEDKAAF